MVLVGAGLVYKGSSFSAQQTNNPIKIGALLSQTGVAAAFGEEAHKSIQLAVDDINKNGGIDGRKVELYIEDDHTDPKEAVSGFQKLVSVDRVDAIVGGMFDFATQPLLPIADSSQTTLISPTNFYIPGDFKLTPYSFVMLPSFSSVIRELEGHIAKSNTQKLAVVHFKSVFGQEIVTTLSGVMQELGRPPVIDESYPQIGGNDFRTLILKLKQQNVDTVFLDMVVEDPLTFLRQARDLDFHPAVVGYNGLTDSFTDAGADKALIENATILDWEFSTPNFIEEYQAAYGAVPTKSADKSYAAVYILVQAVARSKDRAEVGQYVATHTFDTPLGKVQFNENHAVDSTPVKIETVKNGVLVPLK